MYDNDNGLGCWATWHHLMMTEGSTVRKVKQSKVIFTWAEGSD